MALIGTGSKVIPNIVSTATWRAVDIDQILAAFAEQLGGVAWSGGSSSIYGGNLDATNFATGMALGSQYLSQPNHRIAINTETYVMAGTAHAEYPAISTTIIANPVTIQSACLSIGGFSGNGTLSGTVTVSVNGTVKASFYVNGDATTTLSVTLSSEPVVQSKALSLSLNTGDLVTVSAVGVNDSVGTMDYSVVCSLLGYGALTV